MAGPVIDIFLLYHFIKRLVTPFEKWEAYKLGIIDKKGKVLRKRKDLGLIKEREAFALFDVLVLNLKKLLAKVPGGSSRIATYAAALLLLKEQNNVSEELIENLDSVFEEYLMEAQMLNEDLRQWFGKGSKGDWVRMDTKGNIKGKCASEPGEGKPKCVPRSKAHSMSKKERASAVSRKRRKDPETDRPGTGNKPINVKTDKSVKEEKTADLIRKSQAKRGAPGTLKRKVKGKMTIGKARALKNKPGATTLDKKQANFFINMHSEEAPANATGAAVVGTGDNAVHWKKHPYRVGNKGDRKKKGSFINVKAFLKRAALNPSQVVSK